MASKSLLTAALVILSLLCSVHCQLSNYNYYTACPLSIGQQLTFIPHPRFCTKYYYCVLGSLVEFNCPGGLHFDRRTKACTRPEVARCPHFPTWPTPITTTPLQPTSTNVPNNTICGEPEWREYAGNLTSPRYPNMYPNNMDCYYSISGPIGTFISIHTNNLNLENGHDYIAIYSGNSTRNAKLAQITGSGAVGDVHAPSHTVLVHFHTDGSIQRTGFHMTFTASTCAGQLEYGGLSGTIVSPNYPFAFYPNRINCHYKIVTRSSKYRVAIRINHLDLEDCPYDVLQLYDGPTSNAPMLANLCGDKVENNTIYYLSSNQAFINFKADVSYNRKGFNISYFSTATERTKSGWITSYTDTTEETPETTLVEEITTETTSEGTEEGTTTEFVHNFTAFCGVLSGSIGNITSPNYPNMYSNNVDCYYSISGPIGTFISIHVNSLNLEPNFDYVDILNGNNTGNASLARITGSGAVNDVHAPSNAVLVHFHTDGSVVRSGFHLTFTASTCAGQLVYGGSSGTIVSPNYPFAYYPNSLNCYYRIVTSPSNYPVVIQINHLDLEYHPMCAYDVLQIYDGPTSNYPSLTKLCGSAVANNTIYLSSNQAFIHFKSDVSVNRPGFNISYFSTQAEITTSGWTTSFTTMVVTDTTTEETPGTTSSEHLPGETTSEGKEDGSTSDEGMTTEFAHNFTYCGVLRGSIGNLTSPNYPNMYSNNVDCYYSILGPIGTFISIHVNSLDLESLHDYVDVFTGNNTGNASLARITGSGAVDDVHAPSNTVLVHFHTDRSVVRSGFHMTFTASTCGSVPLEYGGSSGTIVSPNYPFAYYPSNLSCYKKIVTRPPNYPVVIQINHLDLENHPTCAYDVLQIYDGPTSNYPSLTKLCGSAVANNTIYLSSNQAFIYFKTDASVNRPGFNISYSVVAP